MPATIRRVAVTSAPRDRLWVTISTGEGLTTWLGTSDLAGRVGHRSTLRTAGLPGMSTTVRLEVLAVAPLERVLLAWRSDQIETEVELAISEVGNGLLRLDVTHRGFRGVRQRANARSVVGPAWTAALHRLVQHLSTY